MSSAVLADPCRLHIRGVSSYNLRAEIQRMVATAGLNMVTGDLTMKGELEELVPDLKRLNSITDIVPALIRNSAAFIQIIPLDILDGKRSKTEEGLLNWLLFEFGAAQALQLPCAILVDVRQLESDIGRWKELLRVGQDYQLQPFDSSIGSRSLYGAIEIALEQLAIRVPSQVRP